MTWGNVRDAWDNEHVTAAAAAGAAQLPVAAVVAFVLSLDDDSYGTAGYDGAFGLACVALLLPLLLPVLGLVHACVQTVPGLALGRAAARRARRGPKWAWTLGGQLVPGAGWGILFAALGGPFVGVTLWAAASGVLPALAVAYWARRPGRGLERARRRRIWVRSGLASVGLCVALLVVAFMATVTGVIKEYEPPQLSPEQVAGVWRHEDGGKAVLRLRADGRVDLAPNPYEDATMDGRVDPVDAREASRCEVTGTWTIDVDDVDDTADRRPVVTVETDGCDGRNTWMIGGTEDDPELFVDLGSIDAPEIEILVKD
ncbi:hypothetical protein AB0O76_42005 [Streptomyces sp. NPDC086554]|uniref:hypothetical protein n=1 Tax=Streptomyces sp. NPDC086554 TaxID=3154864 RepID=UPI00342FAFFF